MPTLANKVWEKELTEDRLGPIIKIIHNTTRGQRMGSGYDAFFFPQRERAAFFAIADRRAALSFAARAFPPFNPPSRPSETAAGFFSCVASPTMRNAVTFGPLLERLGMKGV